MSPRVWFFGCWGGHGHYMWWPDRRQVSSAVWRTALHGKKPATWIDSGLMKPIVRDGKRRVDSRSVEVLKAQAIRRWNRRGAP